MRKTNSLGRKKSAVMLTLIFLLSFCNIGVALAEDTPQKNEPIKIIMINGNECVDGEVLVKFSESASSDAINSALSTLCSTPSEEVTNDNLILADVPEGNTVEDFIETLEKQDNVEYAQPNYLYRLERTVNDPAAQLPDPDQWHLQ